MADKHLKGSPHNTTPHTWWYEDSKGIHVYADCEKALDGARVTRVIIPWRSLEAAVRRKRKPETA